MTGRKKEEGMEKEEDVEAFEAVKRRMNLMFEREEYVSEITDMEEGPMAVKTLERWDKRQVGRLCVGDEAFDGSVQVYSLARREVVPLQSFAKNGRPLVLTFGSFS